MRSSRFEWDEDKNLSNQRKHRISFERAIHVFDDPHRIILRDDAHSVDEDRLITIGMVEKILFVVYTERRTGTRIISARYATAYERWVYYDQNGYFDE